MSGMPTIHAAGFPINAHESTRVRASGDTHSAAAAVAVATRTATPTPTGTWLPRAVRT